MFHTQRKPCNETGHSQYSYNDSITSKWMVNNVSVTNDALITQRRERDDVSHSVGRGMTYHTASGGGMTYHTASGGGMTYHTASGGGG